MSLARCESLKSSMLPNGQNVFCISRCVRLLPHPHFSVTMHGTTSSLWTNKGLMLATPREGNLPVWAKHLSQQPVKHPAWHITTARQRQSCVAHHNGTSKTILHGTTARQRQSCMAHHNSPSKHPSCMAHHNSTSKTILHGTSQRPVSYTHLTLPTRSTV